MRRDTLINRGLESPRHPPTRMSAPVAQAFQPAGCGDFPVAGFAAPVSDPQNSKWVTSGYPANNRVVFGPTVKISRHARLLKPGDHSTGREFNAQVIQTKTFSPEFWTRCAPPPTAPGWARRPPSSR